RPAARRRAVVVDPDPVMARAEADPGRRDPELPGRRGANEGVEARRGCACRTLENVASLLKPSLSERERLLRCLVVSPHPSLEVRQHRHGYYENRGDEAAWHRDHGRGTAVCPAGCCRLTS